MKIIFQKTILETIPKKEWQKVLTTAKRDDVVGISHAEISGDSKYRIHVASISRKVGSHFHKTGNEDYSVVSGEGTLHWGKVDQEKMIVKWEKSIPVKTGDSFTIPQGYAHQLENTGKAELIILFGCPDSHLSTDRTLLDNSPSLLNK